MRRREEAERGHTMLESIRAGRGGEKGSVVGEEGRQPAARSPAGQKRALVLAWFSSRVLEAS